MKRCKVCREWKDDTEFYAHKKTIDLLMGKCKECKKLYQRAWDRKRFNRNPARFWAEKREHNR